MTASSPLYIMLSLFGLMLSLTAFASNEHYGFSGMTQVDDNRFLVVIDKKSHVDGPRLGILTVNAKTSPNFTPITVSDWHHNDGQASDLESVCKLPLSDNEYLVAESGYWKGRNGRIFRLLLVNNNIQVTRVYKLPLYYSNDDGVDGDNFEGMVCFHHGQQIYVMLGERGGSERYPTGLLRLGKLNNNDGTLDWYPPSQFALPVTPAEYWPTKQSVRSISELYLDPQGIIWASATMDKSDYGPFTSLIYSVGKLSIEEQKILLKPATQSNWQVNGFKVEALAGPAAAIPGAIMSIGSEDEKLGGVWRPIMP